jgi:hypothetical protein
MTPTIIKISALTELTTPADGDNLVIEDISEPLDVNKTKRITFLNFIQSFIPNIISKRQGGSSTVWDTPGTTTYTPTPTNVKIQVGVTTFTVSDNATPKMENTITFPVAFSYKPIVLATVISDSSYATGGAVPAIVQTSAINSSSAYIRIKYATNFNNGTVFNVAWMAIGE